MDKKTIVITGASDGIGKAAAKKLKELGHNVIIVGRSKEKTENVAKELDCPYYLADFARFSDVVALADELNKLDRIDVLANNAGAVIPKLIKTVDGNEMTYQVNVLSPFLLTYLLLPKLRECNATVIQTSSIAANIYAKYNEYELGKLHYNFGEKYEPFTVYGNTKLANILFTKWLNFEYKDKGINAVAFEPGVVRTNFGAEMKGIVKLGYHTPIKYLFTISPEKSAERLVWLATGTPGKDFEGGETYSKVGEKMDVKFKDEDLTYSSKLWGKLLVDVGDNIRF